MGAEEVDLWQRQHHEDMGGVNARLVAAERGIGDLGTRFDAHTRSVDARFDGLQQTIISSNRDLSEKITSANVTFASSGKTNWANIFAGVAIIVAIGGSVISGIMLRLGENTTHIERLDETRLATVDFYKHEDKIETWLTRLTDRVHDDEQARVKPEAIVEFAKRVDDRDSKEEHDAETRSARVEARIDAIDGQLVKRPELEASSKAAAESRAADNRNSSERLDALSARMNAFQAALDALFPGSKVIEELQRNVSELRMHSLPARPPAD